MGYDTAKHRREDSSSIFLTREPRRGPVEGVLMIVAGGKSATGPYQVKFAPYASRGGALEPHLFADRSALDEFLHELRVGAEEKQRAFTALARENSADIVNLQLSPVELRRYWPAQFSVAHD